MAMNPLAQSWLELQCRILSGTSQAIVMIKDAGGGHFTRAAAWPAASESAPDLQRVAKTAAQQRKCVIQRESNAADDDEPNVDIVGYPLLFDGKLAGVVALRLSARPEDQRRAVVQLLGWGASWLQLCMQQRSDSDGENFLQIVRTFASCLDHENYAAAASALANEITIMLICDRVSVGHLKGRSAVVQAVSNNAHIDRRTRVVTAIADAMSEAIEQQARIAYPADDDEHHVSAAHAALSKQTDGGKILSIPLVHAGKSFGCITLERAAAVSWNPDDIRVAEQIAALAGPVLELKLQQGRSLYRTALDHAGRELTRLTGRGHTGFKLAAAGATLLAAFGFFATGDFRVKADASLEGAVQRALVAKIDGYVASAGLRAGDIVATGDVLAQLDDSDLALERIKWAGEHERFEKEYREARADRELAQVSILSAQLKQAQAQLELIEAQLARTNVLAPFDGIIIEGDLSQSLGAPVSRGDVLFRIAPVDDYRVVLEVDERDISYVRSGQQGVLTLTGLPGERFPIRVEKLTPVAESGEGQNRFRVEASLPARIPALRPGMEGIGKVSIEQRRLAWIWTHRAFDWLRLQAWSWWA